MQASCHVYAIRDARGDIDFDVASDESVTIYLSGYDPDGIWRSFEAEAYHAELWALKHNFKYQHIKQFFNIKTLF